MTQKRTAVVDRIEDGIAVLLLEDDDGAVVEERTLPREDLPSAVDAGDVLELTIADGSIAELAPCPETTAARKQRAQDRFDRLSERPDEKQ